MSEEEKLEEITKSEFSHDLLNIKKGYLESVDEFTKLYNGVDDIQKHLNFLHCNNYQVKFYKSAAGEINYDFKRKEPVGFRGNK